MVAVWADFTDVRAGL